MFNSDQHNRPVYIISVAAELVNVHPQTLRMYERKGLVAPKRQGKNRLYSQADIQKLLYIQELTQELGINLAGVERIMTLQQELSVLKSYKEQELKAINDRLSQLETMKLEHQEEINLLRKEILDEND
jgi:MerR family transcriptional regulator, heat shock protein HspR